MSSLSAHLGLFATAVLAATLLPGSSEAVLVTLVDLNSDRILSLFVVATAGNTLGSVINWALGRWLGHYAGARWFPVSRERLAQAAELTRKYGLWALLLSWVPIIGDPITLAAGVLRVPFFIFVILVAFAKAARYLVLIGAFRLL